MHGEAKGFEKDPEVDAEPPSPYDLRRLLFAKGNAFETGIFALLGVICSVLIAIAAFFVFIIRRAATHPLPLPSETLSSAEPFKA